jgi:hypothetical protein
MVLLDITLKSLMKAHFNSSTYLQNYFEADRELIPNKHKSVLN